MNQHIPSPVTLLDVTCLVEQLDMSVTRRRDMISAIRRIGAMIGCAPQSVPVDVNFLRQRLAMVLPAAHGISAKTFANLKSLFIGALECAGFVDPMPRGVALKHSQWRRLLKSISHDKRQACGLAAFANWCAVNDILPCAVRDEHVLQFLAWLESRTLCPRPRDIVRRVPNIWNEAARETADWPGFELSPLSFRVPSEHLTWDELHEDFRRDVSSYLAARKTPDPFDDRPNAPRRPLAESTTELQRAHIRLAASILVQSGTPVDRIRSLSNLVEPGAFKAVLRHYHDRAEGRPSAFAHGVAKTLSQVAKYHVGVETDQIGRLTAIAAKLPAVPFDLTEKNKALLQKFDSETTRAKLFYLSEDLLCEVQSNLDNVGMVFVDAQVAIAVDIALIAPLRPKNLTRLNWRRHFVEPDGKRGRVMLHIPAAETKTKRRDLTFALPEDAVRRIRWYRREILTRLGADPNGDLFVNVKGVLKDQKTFTSQIIKRIETHVGIHMTPHQFRHLAAKLYLEAHPEDFRTVTDLLGHSSAKTTLMYAGVSNERASKVYTNHIVEQRKTLQLKRRWKKKA